jgi:hypothetical protein
MDRLRSWPLVAILIAASMVPVSHAIAEPTFAADASLLYDSNLTRAQQSTDVRPDNAARFGVETGQFFVPTGSDTIDVAAFARSELYHRYHGLNHADFGAYATARHKFATGYDAPWLRVSIEGSHDNFNDALRDSNLVLIDAKFGFRYSPALDLAAGLLYDRRYDNHGESIVPGIPGTVFDLHGFGGYARAGYAFSDLVYGALRLGVRRGDVESTAQQSLPIFLASTAITEDPAFGDEDLYAYRLRGTTWTAATTGSIALDPRTSLNLSYTEERTYAAYGNQYRSRVVILTLAYRP